MSVRSTQFISREQALAMLRHDIIEESTERLLERIKAMSNDELGIELDFRLQDKRPYENWQVRDDVKTGGAE